MANGRHIYIVFAEIEPPRNWSGPCMAFVEVEDENGSSIKIGEWIRGSGSLHRLRIRASNVEINT